MPVGFPGAATVTLARTQASQLLSRSIPVFATTGTAANATSSNYNNVCTSTGTPQEIALDISGIPPNQKTSNEFYWWNVGSQFYFDYAHAGGLGGSLTNGPVAYTIDGNTAAGGTKPTSGWTNLVTVTGNVYTSRKHSIVLTGYNWVRINVTSSSNTNVAIKVDLYDTSQGSALILNVGDSRYNYSMYTNNPSNNPTYGTTTCDAFTNLVFPITDFFMPQINMGMSGFNSTDVSPLVSGWMTDFPGAKYATVNLGTNDANQGAFSSAYTTAMTTIVNALQTAGATVYLETIGATTDATVNGRLTSYNGAIPGIIASTGCKAGADIFTLYTNNINLMGDALHMGSAGQTLERTFRAAFIAAAITGHG